jgi:predicted anti-sigma-YlaC factor YlaD
VTCREVIGLLGDYLESTLRPDTLGRLEEHLHDCPACRVYLSTYQRTREVTARVGRVEMPDEMKARLRSFLLRQLKAPPR